MRKLLLGGTAIAAAALFMPTEASAQTFRAEQNAGPAVFGIGPLNVRLGGYFRTFYSYTDQPGRSSGANFGNVVGETRVGNSDFQHEVEVHVEAAGKAANGLRYGVSVEIEADLNRTGQGAVKNALTLDEVFAWMAGPFGQIRIGDEDSAWQLMGQGHITGFGIGGLDSGDFGDSVIGAGNRPTFNFLSDPGDNTRLTYLTPQFFGFDAGVSFAFNNNEGGLSGCDALANTCDRLSAIAGGIATRRRNEIVGILRYRGTFGTFGFGAHAGYFGADPVANTTSGLVGGGNNFRRINMGLAGIQATAFGLTIGGHGTFGEANAGFNTLERDAAGNRRDDRNMSSYMVGLAYTIDAFTFGGHYAQINSAGSQTFGTGGRRDRGFSVGANYRIAPGIDFVAEYNRIYRREAGFNFVNNAVNTVPGTFGANNSADVTVFLAGMRIAF